MSLQTSDNWFWVLNASEDGYEVDIERVVAWEKSEQGWVGLISPKLEGPVLKEPPPVAGGTYKHLDDLTPLEIQALEKKSTDPAKTL